ncbi:MAG: family 43 glycosylhydrolase [Bacteroidaceae bacterium]|nr:family 43 glycosylhydrolase [Bacteroidaceae bacterium]
MKRLFTILTGLWAAVAMSAQDGVCFDFTSTTDTQGTYSGSLRNGARLSALEGIPILDLGDGNGYFDFGTELGKWVQTFDDYTIAMDVFVPETTNLSGNGNFVWCFARSSSAGYLFANAKDTRMAITKTTYSAEQGVSMGQQLKRGQWVNLLYRQEGNKGQLYLDGVLAKEATISLKPSALTSLTQNYLGRSCYSGDAYLKGAQYHNVQFYNHALTADSIALLVAQGDELKKIIDDQSLARLLEQFTLGDVSALTRDLRLPTEYEGGVTITWATSDASVITADGHITRPAIGSAKATATMTATMTTERGSTVVRQFEVGVLPLMTDDEATRYAADHLRLEGNLHNLYTDLNLPSTAADGCVVGWTTSDSTYLTRTGHIVRYGEGEMKHVVLTAHIVRGESRTFRDFDIHLHQNEPYTNYLFVYFPSNSDENIYYALSADGYNYTPLNNGTRVVAADTLALKKGVRDPHILRGDDGWFYMVNTDMRCAEGWDSNRGMVLMRSRDLIHWSHSTVHFPTRYKGTLFANVTRVWAPETIWDAEAGKLMVYFSILTNDGNVKYDKVYYAYANSDFTDLESEPQYFYDRGSATIDMDIVYNPTDSLYHGFFKNEGQGGICQVTARRLTPEPGQPAGSQWSAPSGTLQQTSEAVEGAGVFKLINKDSWILMYDCYTNGHYQFCSSSDLVNFAFEKNTTTSGAFTPRHGTVLPITAAETEALMEAFPTKSLQATITGATNPNIRQELVETSGTNLTLPVVTGTDLTAFDPMFSVSVGTVVTPEGPQDFSQGAVNFRAKNTAGTKTYRVTVRETGNPVLPDFHADPEVLYSQQTGRFYIYPTTDGYPGWGGYSFDVFSSPDLVHFTNEGTILDLSSGGDVPWADGNAWAPCIEEKQTDGQWRYFFYFSGNNPSLGKKTIGVATSDSPVGPFTAETKPLITSSNANQIIDGDVFTDPVSGQSYLYYGNGRLCYRLLDESMTKVVGSEYTITPSGGTLSTYAFREGVYVFYRNGLYYFLWSVDDTGAANYHVAYGMSKSPTGPITVASDPIVIIQRTADKIYGTGHNSVVNIPGTDDWYIVYHRINKNYLNSDPGIHREVCIDRLTFDDEGLIQRVTPTHEGISPVTVNPVLDTIIDGIDTTIGDRVTSLRVTYFRLDGTSLGTLSPSTPGIYVRREQLANGRFRTLKMLVR